MEYNVLEMHGAEPGCTCSCGAVSPEFPVSVFGNALIASLMLAAASLVISSSFLETV